MSVVLPRRSSLLPPVLLVVLTLLATATSHQMADGRTDQIIRVYYGVGFLVLSLSVWWLGFANLRRRNRWLIWMGCVLGGTILAMSCIRSIWFDGDMRPLACFSLESSESI
jgi:hypothetical protein